MQSITSSQRVQEAKSPDTPPSASLCSGYAVCPESPIPIHKAPTQTQLKRQPNSDTSSKSNPCTSLTIPCLLRPLMPFGTVSCFEPRGN